MDKNTEFGNRIKEIEQLQKKYSLAPDEILMLRILVIIEHSGFTYETYKKVIEERT
jgi:hypothetical protein